MTALEMEYVLKMPVERRIMWLEEVWDSILPESDNLHIPSRHKEELDRRLEKYADNPAALLTEQELKLAVNARR